MSGPHASLYLATDVGDQLVGVFQNPGLLLGIPLAIAGAVFMSLGAQYQSQGVRKVERMAGEKGLTGLSLSHLLKLLTRPSWVVGTVLLLVAIGCQLSAMSVAPLIVVQPLGAISLVITTLLNAQRTGHAPTRKSITAIMLCVGGIFAFVVVAALYANEQPLTDFDMLLVLAVLLVMIILLGAAWIFFRAKIGPLFYITAAGVLYGFVATLAKMIIKRIQEGTFDIVVLLCLISLIAASIAGAYFVQTAYSSGPPDLVIAGLTVIDPIAAVLIATLILHEAAAAPPWALVFFVLAGGVASFGVVMLTRSHPQVLSESQQLEFQRGDSGKTARAANPSDGLDANTSTALDDLRQARDPEYLTTRQQTPPPVPKTPASEVANDPEPPRST